MRIFVTGTDTGVGKTVVSAWLCVHLQATYWKPVQCGTAEETDRDFVIRTTGQPALPERYLLRTPASPHYAAECEQRRLAVRDFQLPVPLPENLVIEGAGGVEVPLNETERMVDLMRALALPALVVARGTLGTINHTLLTIEALRRRNIPILGVVFTGSVRPENAAAISQHSGISVITEIPALTEFSRTTFSAIEFPDFHQLSAKLALP